MELEIEYNLSPFEMTKLGVIRNTIMIDKQ